MNEETRLKILDGNRKEVLQLPSGAVHLWFAYYMCESEGREAYPSVRTLAKLTKKDPKTVNKWQHYLLEKGWLVPVGGTAADRYSKPTQGSHRIPIVRVDDPTKGVGNFPTVEEAKERGVGITPTVEEGVGTFLVGNIPTKVSGSVSGSYSGSGSDSSSVRTHAQSSFGRDMKDDPSGQSPSEIEATPEPTTKPKAKTPVFPVQVKLKKSPKYREPFPVDFDTWTNIARLEWTEKHKVPVEGKSGEVPIQEQKSSVPVESKPSGLSPVTTQKDSAPVVVEKQTTTQPARPPNTPPDPARVPVKVGVADKSKPEPMPDEPVIPVEGVDVEFNVIVGVSKVSGPYRHECWQCLHCKRVNMAAGDVTHLNAWHKPEGKVWVEYEP